MKKATFRLQPRFQIALNDKKNSGNHNDKDNDEYDYDDDASSIYTLGTAWRKRRTRRKERQVSEKKTFFKMLNVARVLLFLLSIMMMMQYQSDTMDIEDSKATASLTIDDNTGVHNDKKKRNQDSIEGDEIVIISRHAIKPLHYSEPIPSLQLPSNIDTFYADLLPSSSIISDNTNIVPVFWHILKSGGTSVKDLYGICLQKVEAAGMEFVEGENSQKNDILQIIQLAEGGINRVNVDTSTGPGIIRAIKMNLVSRQLADIIFTPLLHEAAELFHNNNNNNMLGLSQQQQNQDYKGLIFCLMRHPLERAVSLFHYLQKATWEPTYNEEIKKIKTVEDYAISEFAENNWMTRFLSNKMSGVLSRNDVEIAKEILRRKVLIGLVIDVEGSVTRFNKYFGWDKTATSEQQRCANQILKSGSNKNVHKLVEEGGMAWRILRANNLFDLELYEYALQLYEEQKRLFF